MPVLLSPALRDAVRPLIPGPAVSGHTAFAHAVLDGWLPGRAFADRADDPRSAIVCADNGFLLACGRADPELADVTIQALQDDLLVRLVEERALVASGQGWDQALSAILPSRTTRREFHFERGPTEQPGLPDGYRAEPVSHATTRLFGQGIDPWVVRTLGGPGPAAVRTFGTAVLAPDGSLAAACLACAVGGGEAEIEIGTAAAHRRRGLAAAAAVRFFAQCSDRALTPAWTCAADNAPSAGLARRLGFREFREVAVFPLPPDLVRVGNRWARAAG